MKKNYIPFLFLIFLGLSWQMNAQSKRVAFIEEATQASCPPCGVLNPPLQALVNANADKVIFMGYQVWWPGFDPMYLDNTTEVQARVGAAYYGFAFAPQIVMQGAFVTGSGDLGALGNLNQAKINAVADQDSEFDMALQAEIVNGSLKVTGSVDATKDINGELRLRLAIIEHIITKIDAPGGTNTETEYHNVFKKFIGGPEGITLPDTVVAGYSYNIDETFDLGTLNIYNYDQIQVIGFVQNDNNKAVLQAAIAKDIPITVVFDNNAGAFNVLGLPAKVCSGSQTVEPTFVLQNTGNEVLTSATITYDVNGGTSQTYDWTGSLTTLAKTTVPLPAITFDAEASNTVNVQVAEPNGVSDESSSDNQTTSAAFVLAPTSDHFVVVELKTDGYGDEVYWEVRDGSGTVVDWGGNPNVGTTNIGTGTFPAPPHPAMYGNQTTYKDTVNILSLDCFTFHITDYFGDGISDPASANAYFRVRDNAGNILIQGGGSDRYAERMDNFEGSEVNSTRDLTVVSGLRLFPNPATDEVAITFDLSEKLDNTTVEIANIVGQRLLTQQLGTLLPGLQQVNLNVSHLQNGLYTVTINSGQKIVAHKLTVQK